MWLNKPSKRLLDPNEFTDPVDVASLDVILNFGDEDEWEYRIFDVSSIMLSCLNFNNFKGFCMINVLFASKFSKSSSLNGILFEVLNELVVLIVLIMLSRLLIFI